MSNTQNYLKKGILIDNSLPPFKELLRGIRNYSGLLQMQPSHYSYSPRPVESNKSRQLSYVSSVIGTDEGAMRSSRLLSVGLTLFMNKKRERLQFDTLAKVSGSQYYNSPDSVKKKEEDILSFLTWFLPGHATLADCLSEMNANLLRGKLKGSKNLSTEILFSQDLQRNEVAITRDEFKKWVIDIPDVLYNNISTSLEKFSLILHELKIMKYNYKLENEIEIRDHKEQEQWLYKKECDSPNHQHIGANSRCVNNNTGEGDYEDRELTESPPTKNKLHLPRGPNKQKIRKPRTKCHNIKKQKIKCNHCESTETPEWRRGPDGSRTLCNACGLFYSKLTKRYGTEDAVVIMKSRKTEGLISDRTIPSLDALKRMVGDT